MGQHGLGIPLCFMPSQLPLSLRAKREDTKKRRLAQMLDELASGDKYMKMKYSKKRR